MAIKYTLAQLIEEYSSTEKYFDQGRIIFGLNNPNMTMFDREDELNRINSFQKQLLIHLIMVLIPDVNQEEDTSPTEELVNKYLIPTARALIKSKISPGHLMIEVSNKDLTKIKASLNLDHDWHKALTWDERHLSYIYYQLLFFTYDLAYIHRKDDKLNPKLFYKMLEDFKEFLISRKFLK